jgi:hypothetical protein
VMWCLLAFSRIIRNKQEITTLCKLQGDTARTHCLQATTRRHAIRPALQASRRHGPHCKLQDDTARKLLLLPPRAAWRGWSMAVGVI